MLQQKLHDLATVYKEQVVVIRGDENVNYKYVVQVMDACRAAQLTNIAFSTNRPGKDEGQ